MRNHGWHLPYHPLQIVAVAVFSALAFSFYVFFVPFVGNNVLKFHVIAAFSPLVFAVFTLYIRCAAIDPADSGIKAQKTSTSTRKLESQADILLRDSLGDGIALDQMDDEVRRNLQAVHASKRSGQAERGCVFTGLLCPVVTAWRYLPGMGLSRRLFGGGNTEQERSIPEEELLFCSLCEAEILKSSKHCRACDKCVDGFDHHCRWLNNCIGRKNYKTFVAVMVSSLLMLVMEWAIGILVLVRCFTDKRKFDKEIVEKLGSSFTRIPFVVVLMLCTFLAMLATLPLTQLLFFHLILIKKGITTYDYIVAIREQETQEPVPELQVGGSPLSSPASSVTTAVSGGSSSGALHRAVWCTPPRMFVENQSNMKAEVVLQYATSHWGGSPRVNTEAGEGVSTRYPKDGVIWQPKRQIGLSPWKLARLNAKDAAKAAARARESSAILRPVKYGANSVITETEDSSVETNTEITNAPGGYKVGWRLDLPMSRDRSGLGNEHRNPLFNASLPAELCSGRLGQDVEGKGGHPILPLRLEARSPFRSRSLQTVASFPLTASFMASPDDLGSPYLIDGDARNDSTDKQERSGLYRATSDGYEASGGESADDTVDHGRRFSHAWSKLKFNQSFITRNGAPNASLKWSSGLEGVMAAQSQPDSIESSTCETRSHGSGVEANILNHVKTEWPGIRESFPTSTDESNKSSPSYYLSPKRGISPDIQSTIGNHFNSRLDKTNSKDSRRVFYEPPLTGRSSEPMVGKKGLSSTKRLKESILSYRRGLSSSSYSGGALLSSSP